MCVITPFSHRLSLPGLHSFLAGHWVQAGLTPEPTRAPTPIPCVLPAETWPPTAQLYSKPSTGYSADGFCCGFFRNHPTPFSVDLIPCRPHDLGHASNWPLGTSQSTPGFPVDHSALRRRSHSGPPVRLPSQSVQALETHTSFACPNSASGGQIINSLLWHYQTLTPCLPFPLFSSCLYSNFIMLPITVHGSWNFLINQALLWAPYLYLHIESSQHCSEGVTVFLFVLHMVI